MALDIFQDNTTHSIIYIIVALLFGISGYFGFIFLQKTAAKENLGKLLGKFTNKPVSDDLGDVEFRIRIPRMRYDPIEKVVHFQIILKYQGQSWDTWRRYSDFRAFYRRHDFNPENKFPPKSTFAEIVSGAENTLEFVDKRRKQLEAFMKEVIPNGEVFGQLCVYLKEEGSRLGPTGQFFAIPKNISFENIKLNPSREELLKAGLKGFDILMEQMELIDADPAKKPWEVLHESKDKNVRCNTWQDGDFLHISVKAKVPCEKGELLDLLLDGEMRLEWDDNHEMQHVLDAFFIGEVAPNKATTSDWETVHKNQALMSADEKTKLSQIASEVEAKHNYKIVMVSAQYSRMKSPAPMVVAKRDFVTVCVLAQHIETKTIAMVLSSIDYNLPASIAKEASSGGYVRAKYICAATVLKDQPVGDNSEMLNLTMIDPGAYVPPRIIKMFAPQKANEVPGMGLLAKKRKQSKPPGISAFLQ